MPEANMGSRISTSRLVVVPGVITLGVTILRLVGELQHWSKTLFNWEPGGGGGIVGIVWLAPIFGIYFALKLAAAGEGPGGLGKAFGYWLLGLLLMVGGIALSVAANFRDPIKGIAGLILIAAAGAVQFWGWPSLAKTLLAYGYSARIPVAIIMFFAIRGDWGTHYDAPPPNFPPVGFWPKYLLIGLVPQLIGWITFTVISGSLFGTIAASLARRGKATAQAAP